MRFHTSRHPQQKTIDRPPFCLFAGMAALIVWGAVAGAQEGPLPAPTPVPTPIPAPTPVPAAEISERAANTRALLRSGTAQAQIADQLEEIDRDFAAERKYLEALLEETGRRMEVEGPASVLEETEKAWARGLVRLDRWLLTLREKAARLEGALRDIETERELWRLTREAAGDQELPLAVRQKIDDTVAAINAAEREVRASRDRVLVLQAHISSARTAADEMLAVQREEIAQRRRTLLRVDSPPLWKVFAERGVHDSRLEQLAATWKRHAAEIRAYVADEPGGPVRHVMLLIMVAVVLTTLRGRALHWVQQDRSLERTVRVLQRPLAAALVITIFLRDLIYPEAPAAWLHLLTIVMLIAVLRVFPLLVRPAMRPLVYYLVLLFVLRGATALTTDGTLIDRVLLLAMSLIGTWTGWRVLRQTTHAPPQIPRGWLAIIQIGTRLAMALFLAAAAADIVGAVGLSTLLVMETLFSVSTAVLFWIAAVVLRAVVRVGLLTATARRFGVIRLHTDEVRHTLFRVIDLLAVGGWFVAILVEVKVLAPATDALQRVLGAEFHLGEITIVPGNVVLFAVVIWLSFKLSQLIRISLDTDVYPRMELPRGVPGAINRLTHYALIVIGVMFAATAAGLDFTRLTFVIGALGVGIGFGLQNVVNNFVSGLILLFERPIRIGDRVELSSELSGTVERIGIRASVVRTWQGAEVIVPNANLISSEVINWTLSDDRRRMEIPVGVAYGTEPEVVLELLLGVARAHTEVLDDPEPVALFTGFGDSSLGFELRAWTTGDIVVIPSELRVAINRKLAAAGIEIPFPQRDLHLRSVAREAADRLGIGERSP